VRAVGIDLGQSQVWGVAAERRGRRWRIVDGRSFPATSLADAVAWCGDAAVAIDAPGGRSERVHLEDTAVAAKFRPARCAEVALRLAGHAVPWIAPGPADPAPGWMEVGFALWEALGDGPRLEVYPHAVFVELLGSKPPRKTTPAGREARLRALAGHLELPPGAELWTHDGIDAAAAALVAAHHLDGRARRLACEGHDGSVMWLPAPS
jgi:hypothetical protein